MPRSQLILVVKCGWPSRQHKAFVVVCFARAKSPPDRARSHRVRWTSSKIYVHALRWIQRAFGRERTDLARSETLRSEMGRVRRRTRATQPHALAGWLFLPAEAVLSLHALSCLSAQERVKEGLRFCESERRDSRRNTWARTKGRLSPQLLAARVLPSLPSNHLPRQKHLVAPPPLHPHPPQNDALPFRPCCRGLAKGFSSRCSHRLSVGQRPRRTSRCHSRFV